MDPHIPTSEFEAELMAREIARQLQTPRLEVHLLDPMPDGRWQWIAYRLEPFDLLREFQRPFVSGYAWIDEQGTVWWTLPVQDLVDYEQTNTAHYFAPIVLWRECLSCGLAIRGEKKQRYCSATCRQRAQRARRAATAP